ncbi:hypothetical protein B0T24DRAFT_118398 [Lasiosphaeria ovina]|uniref:Uncharacterized protein n=1 Tax=Lasiosphaeria ovina TaxID=92902 RepID=A0AAE0MZD1_9PEZI|nr:hypothetical protein B0T24DRAFT_118398 [Lasiosphaeria ovina]
MPEFHMFGDHLAAESEIGDRPRTVTELIRCISSFERLSGHLERQHEPRNTDINYLFILDGVCPYLRLDTTICPDDTWSNCFKMVACDSKVLFLVGSYCDLSPLRKELGGRVTTFFVSNTAAVPSLTHAGFRRFLRQPDEPGFNPCFAPRNGHYGKNTGAGIVAVETTKVVVDYHQSRLQVFSHSDDDDALPKGLSQETNKVLAHVLFDTEKDKELNSGGSFFMNFLQFGATIARLFPNDH